MADNKSQNINITNKLQNPFVGIRPLKTEEKHLFFGRDKHVKSAVEKLYTNHFLVISGASGIGKSSLVNCGIIPEVLNKGQWKTIHSEITDSPLENLINDILRICNKTSGDDTGSREKNIKKSELIRYLKEDFRISNSSYLFFIDQFEQIILNRNRTNQETYEKSLASFISILVDLINEAEIPVYIIMTIRSDYLGKFSDFSEFSELIGEGNYLLPQMAEDEIYEAIRGPLDYAGVDWDKQLPERIIQDFSDIPDKLPLMQHVLLRTYNIWKESARSGEPVSIASYEEAGAAGDALQRHAEEAFNELDSKNKQICERIFKTLTAKTSDNHYVKLNIKIGELGQIVQADDYLIIKIVNVFNKKNRSFLTPPQDTLLTEDSYVSLSHEVLIRNWERLKKWVDEETESIQMYKRLAESAYQFQLGKSELWNPPELDDAVKWREKNSPNITWARRHNPAFERTMVFLNLSENERYQELEKRERFKRIKKRWIRALSIFAGIVAVLVLAMILFTNKSGEDTGSALESQSNDQVLADYDDNIWEDNNDEPADDVVDDSGDERDRQTESAALQIQPELRQQEDPGRRRRERATLPARDQAEENRERTDIEEPGPQNNIATNAEISTNETDREVIIPLPAPETEEEEGPGPEAKNIFSSEKMQNLSESMAEASMQTDADGDLKVLLAYQSYLFNSEYNNNSFETYIYDALYQSMKAQLGSSFNALTGHSKAVRSIDFLPNSATFFTAGSNGNILRWNATAENPQYSSILSGRGILEKIKVTDNGNWLLAAENRSGILLLDLSSGGADPEIIRGNDLNIRSIAVAPDNNTFYTAGTGNYIERHKINSRSSEVIIETDSRINSLTLSPDGQMLAAGTGSGKVITWSTSGNFVRNLVFDDPNNAVHSVSFSPNGRYLASGNVNGKIMVYRTSDFELVGEMGGHTARVTEIDFSPDGRFIASSAYDGSVLLWNMNDLSSLPVVFNDNGGFVFTVKFSQSGNYLVSGSAETNRLVVRPISLSSLADRVCFLVSRNMTKSEWDNYIGMDIPYRKTCPDK